VKQHSQEMSEAVMKQHIDLYVNNYSLDLGSDGKKAVNKLIEVYHQVHQKD
jgi:1,4-dihydroxy-6-naphthoate synthase